LGDHRATEAAQPLSGALGFVGAFVMLFDKSSSIRRIFRSVVSQFEIGGQLHSVT
jgi:hypothetical protein